MRKFYNLIEKMATVSPNLSYSHYAELLPYLSVRKLKAKIKSKEYERLPKDTKDKLIKTASSIVVDFVKNSILIKNNENYKVFFEKAL